MKKNTFKIFAIITIITGFFVVHQNAFAACTKTNYHTVKFNPVSINRTESNLKLKTQVTFEDPACSGVVFDALKDFSFNYTPVGFDNWSEINIPDSSVPISYNTPIELSISLPGTLNKNAVYEGQFRDNNKDVSSTLTRFWADRANFDPIDIKAGSITSDSVEFDGSVKYENSGAASSGRTVPTRNIVARIYKKGGTLIKEVSFNNTSILKYGQVLPLYLKVTELSPDTEYEVRFLDKARTNIDQSYLKPFKTLKKTTGNSNTNTSTSGTQDNSNTTTTTTTTSTTLTSSGQQSFTASSEKYPGITMNGSLTPTVEDGDLSIQGSFTYNYATVPISDVTKGGSLSFHLVDGDGYTSQIIPIDTIPASEIAEYNKPYFFGPGFDNYLKFLDEDGKAVSVERKAPFSLVISDDVLGMRTTKIPVVDVITSTTIAGISQNGAMSGTDANTANNGDGLTTTKVDFSAPTIDSPTDTSIAISAQVTYTNKSKTGAVADENVILQVVDSAGKVAYTSGKLPIDAKYGTPVTVSNTATGLSKDKKYSARFVSNPGTKQILSPAVALAGNTDGKIGKDENPAGDAEQKQSTFGLLRNPLRSGLDSIPDIVSALVKNIVIPIAIPFLALSIIYTGFLFIQARGNKEKLVKAKEALKWTLIGGAIILASYVIATALQGTIADIIR